MHAFVVKIGTHNGCETLQSLVSCKCGGKELLVVQSTVGIVCMVQFSYGHGCCRRPVDILALSRRYAVGQRSLGKSAVRKGAYVLSK